MVGHDERGLAIEGSNGPVRLKWHKLRRRAEDFPFDRGNLRCGAAVGASCEVDLQRLCDGGFVCLHDHDLDRETTGAGAVGLADTETIRSLRLRHPVTGLPGDPPLLLEDLVDELARSSPHRNAVVQLDIKNEDRPPMAALDRFSAAVEGYTHLFIASGAAWPAIAALGAAMPGLRLGFDPLKIAYALWPGDAQAFGRFVGETLKTAPAAETIYLPYQLIAAAHAARARCRGVPVGRAIRRLLDVGPGQ